MDIMKKYSHVSPYSPVVAVRALHILGHSVHGVSAAKYLILLYAFTEPSSSRCHFLTSGLGPAHCGGGRRRRGVRPVCHRGILSRCPRRRCMRHTCHRQTCGRGPQCGTVPWRFCCQYHNLDEKLVFIPLTNLKSSSSLNFSSAQTPSSSAPGLSRFPQTSQWYPIYMKIEIGQR